MFFGTKNSPSGNQQEMDVRSEEGEIPIPLNSSYNGHGNIIVPSSLGEMNPSLEDEIVAFKKAATTIRYRECLKNHAASMGANATDGCGEFMPSGEKGSLEALTCSACHCHRNFHRKEIEGEPSPCDTNWFPRMGRKPPQIGYHHHTSRAVIAPHQMIMPYNIGGCESDDQDEGVVIRPPHQMVKKRFRTKFTQEQKDKMLNFAERIGWKMQKQEENLIQHFCQEIGVKRRVLKVWMHNNKHNLAKRNNTTHDQNQTAA